MIKHQMIRCFSLLLLMVLLAAGCAQDPAPATTEPATEPAVTLPAETEPAADSGPSVTVDGDALASGSILLQETVYVHAGEFLSALDRGEWSETEDGFVLNWENRRYEFSSLRETVLVDHQAVSLFEPVSTYRDGLWLPLEEICTMLNISILEDSEQDTVYCTSGILNLNVPAGIRVPILMYHAVSTEPWGHRELFVTPEVMESHLKYLLDNGYDPIFFEDLPYLDQYDKPMILTFDDGYLDNYTALYPLLQKYQAKATIFVVSSSIGGRETSMTPEQVKELSDSGLVSIQSHTVSHRVLKDLSAEEQRMEMELSRLYIARLTGREPFVISYPTGACDQNTLAIAAEFYRYGVIVDNRDHVTGRNDYTICRYNIRDTTSFDEFAWMICDAGKTA